MSGRRGPVLIEIDAEDTAEIAPASATSIPDDADAAQGQAMRTVAALTTRRPSRLAKWFWSLLATLICLAISVAAWDFVAGLIERAPLVGYAALALSGMLATVLAAVAVREFVSFVRLGRLDVLRRSAATALAEKNLAAARTTAQRIDRLYSNRDELRWGRERIRELSPDIFDADALFGIVEAELLAPLDAAARREVETASRLVAMATAVAPLALIDVAAALILNLRMIRRIAEIYGGGAGALGGWRLARSVLVHLAATGALAMGEELAGSVVGGNMLAKVSRRFGEGVVNGALTARIGLRAMEVCRPLPFCRNSRPSVASLLKRVFVGLFAH